MALFPQEREAHINVLNEYFHKLVVATQSCVSQIADKCLSRHLITSSTQNEILITVGLSPETKARKLLVAVRESMEHQNECLKTFLEVLDELIIFDDLTKEIRSALVQEKSRQKCRGSTGSRTSEKQFIKGSEKKTLTHAQTGTRMSADYFYYVLLVAVVSGLVTIIVTSRSWTMHSDGPKPALINPERIMLTLSNSEAAGSYTKNFNGTLVVAMVTVILAMVIIAAYWLWLITHQNNASDRATVPSESLPESSADKAQRSNDFNLISLNSPIYSSKPETAVAETSLPRAQTRNGLSLNSNYSSQVKMSLSQEHEDETLINITHQSGERVVDLCIKKLCISSFGNVMLKDNNFMKRTAYVMSDFGRNVQGNGGIWQVSYTAFEDTMDTRAHKRLARKYDQIWTTFGINWKTVKYKDLDKPFYSALAARLYLSNIPALIPPENQIEQQAEYWKIHYMGGNGYIELFVDKVHELEQ